jgi:serine/threonine protein kinase
MSIMPMSKQTKMSPLDPSPPVREVPSQSRCIDLDTLRSRIQKCSKRDFSESQLADIFLKLNQTTRELGPRKIPTLAHRSILISNATAEPFLLMTHVKKGKDLALRQDLPERPEIGKVNLKLAIGLQSGEIVVAKVLSRNEVDLNQWNRALSEGEMLEHLSGREGIVECRARAVIRDPKKGLKHYLILERCDKDLIDFCSEDEATATFSQKLNILFDVALGLHYLHQRRCAHLDVKSENVLLKKIGDLYRSKIADFEFVTRIDDSSPLVGTAEFVAPEMAQTLYTRQPLKGQLDKVDVWQLGQLIYGLFDTHVFLLEVVPELGKEESKCSRSRFMQKCFKALTQIKQLQIDQLIDNNPIFDPDVRSLIKKMLRINPQERISISEALTSIIHIAKTRNIRLEALESLRHQNIAEDCIPDLFLSMI